MACDRQVVVNTMVWMAHKNPMAVCGNCFEKIERPVLTQLFVLRSQVRHLYDAVRAVQADVDELFEAYETLK